jgi:hypothetical protein
MAREARHSPDSRRTYRTVPVWQDLALLGFVVVVAVGLFLTWTKY